MIDTEHPPADGPTARAFRQTRFTRPAGATEILLIRHGESEPLVPGRPFPLVDGHGDPALAAEGRAQAQRLAGRLAGHPVDAIYVSTLRRTHETAAPLAGRLGLTPIVEADLREAHLGDWEGELYRQKAAALDPVFLRVLAEQRWDVIPNGEPMDVLRARVRGAMQRIVGAHPDQLVAVVCHGGVIAEILAQASGTPHNFAFLGADNASISQLVAIGERWIVRRFNDTAHLEHDPDTDLAPAPAPLES